jgi:DNA-binding transcriptional LysR family regulator
LVSDFWARINYAPRIIEESDRIAAVLTMVAASQGVSVVPSTVETVITTGVAFRPISGPRPPSLEHCCIYRTDIANEEVDALVSALLQIEKERRSRSPKRSRDRQAS